VPLGIIVKTQLLCTSAEREANTVNMRAWCDRAMYRHNNILTAVQLLFAGPTHRQAASVVCVRVSAIIGCTVWPERRTRLVAKKNRTRSPPSTVHRACTTRSPETGENRCTPSSRRESACRYRTNGNDIVKNNVEREIPTR